MTTYSSGGENTDTPDYLFPSPLNPKRSYRGTGVSMASGCGSKIPKLSVQPGHAAVSGEQVDKYPDPDTQEQQPQSWGLGQACLSLQMLHFQVWKDSLLIDGLKLRRDPENT